MVVFEDWQVRTLRYVKHVNGQGVKPTAAEVEEFANNPTMRRRSSFDGLRIASAFHLEIEKRVDCLVRLGFLSSTSGGVCVTPLGSAVTFSEPTFDHSISVSTVLDDQDPFAYAKFVGSVAELGPGLLVDPYLRALNFFDLVTNTEMCRFLTSDRIAAADRASIRTALAALDQDRPTEFRVASATELHDRYVFTSSVARMIGVSANGIGKKISVITGISEPDASVLRNRYESVWSAADPV